MNPFAQISFLIDLSESWVVLAFIYLIVLIYGSGLAGTHDSWGPQIKGLTGTVNPNDGAETATVNGGSVNNVTGGGIEVCAFDNRGMGRSSIPVKKSEYT